MSEPGNRRKPWMNFQWLITYVISMLLTWSKLTCIAVPRHYNYTILIEECKLPGRVGWKPMQNSQPSPTLWPEIFKNSVFTMKSHQTFSVHITPQQSLVICWKTWSGNRNHMMIVTSSSSQGSFSKRFPSIITRNEHPAFSDSDLKSVLENCYFSRLRDKQLKLIILTAR